MVPDSLCTAEESGIRTAHTQVVLRASHMGCTISRCKLHYVIIIVICYVITLYCTRLGTRLFEESGTETNNMHCQCKWSLIISVDHANNNLLTVNLYFDGVGKARHTATTGR